ncbi:succinylglutamate-semialdehyde dehydrogenase [Novosphingobium sp.]|uniref:succinylglutamate-semialdehyde dehydrogenase n=1 Tax=Novosphingobium sp. TaxID=1874826 RepID=UPI003341728A
MADMLQSIDPASGAVVWQGAVADHAACADAIARARAAAPGWARRQLDERVALARAYAAVLDSRREDLARLISHETGKLLWETRTEIAAMIGKVEISIRAQAERASTTDSAQPFGRAVLRHHPHGVMVVLGPYNFPGHLPNGHIVPALIAGNTVVFKPSELTPATGAAMVDAWHAAGLPADVLQVVQGGRDTGAALIDQDIDGLLFTGSATAGRHFRRALIDRPGVMLALELGGNNPLVVWDSVTDPAVLANLVVHSAFITTGQRCSCARRLIVPAGTEGDAVVAALVDLAVRLPIGAGEDDAFMGPLIGTAAAAGARAALAGLVAAGCTVLLDRNRVDGRGDAFFGPVVLDATGVAVPDAEIFAPVLTVVRVPDFTAAIAAANATAFGLSAGLLSADAALWDRFVAEIRAGVVNWNRPTTGAASAAPFGGLGESGNHRPSAFYAADYCAYPVASFEAAAPAPVPIPGLG